MTKEEFIKKAKSVHGEKYDYSRVEYVNNKTNVCIVCPEHGEFWQQPGNHLKGSSCPKCATESRSNIRRKGKEQFIEEAKKVHGDYYEYSKVEYVNSKTKVCIICPEHGEFWQTPGGHLAGYGCPACFGTHKRTNDEFIREAKKIHGNKYDYSKVDYVNNHTKVCIICPEHGEFWQTPERHIAQKQGCPKCYDSRRGDTLRKNNDWFIEKAREVHGNKYDYSKVDYVNNHTKVCIICPEHGEFWQAPSSHINAKQGCPRCGGRFTYTTEEFIEKARKVHGDLYDYSKVVYKNNTTPVCIICPEHGEFWQKPMNHLAGCGCPECGLDRSKQETKLYDILNEHYNCERHYRFPFLGRQHLDIYLKDFNVAVEYQGDQHFRSVEKWGGEKHFKKQVKRDEVKNKLCKENGVLLLYFVPQKYLNFNELYSENTYSRYDRLLARIEKEIKKSAQK